MVTLDEGGWLGSDAIVTPWSTVVSDVIEHTFVLPMAAATHMDWTVVPDGSSHVIVHRTDGSRGPETTRVSVVGARSASTRIDVRVRGWTVGVRLRPGALPLLTGLPAGDFTDRSTPAEEVWGRSAEGMGDAAAEAHDPGSMLHAVVSFLLSNPGASMERDWKARALTECLGQAHPTAARSSHLAGSHFRVGATAERMGVSVRALRSVSRDLVGLPPKRLARIRRLHAAIALGTESTAPSWSRIAIAAGFADQPHLIREYRNLLGETPARYHRRGHPPAPRRFVQSTIDDSLQS